MSHHSCDCGAPAYKRDGSGWFCHQCELMVARVSQMVTDWIRRERGEVTQNSDRAVECRQARWQRHREKHGPSTDRWRKWKERHKIKSGPAPAFNPSYKLESVDKSQPTE